MGATGGKWSFFLKSMTEGAALGDFTKFVSNPTLLKINVIVCGLEGLTLTAAGNVAQSKFISAFDATSTTPIQENYDWQNWFSVDTSSNHA